MKLADVPALDQAWALTRPLIVELLESDVLLIGAPMYNFSIPGALKTWIGPGVFTMAPTRPEVRCDS